MTDENLKMALSPLLSVRGGQAAIVFYREAFGAMELYRAQSPSGALVAELSLGNFTFWVSDESPAHQNFSPESLGGSTTRFILSVEDPDRVFAQAIRSGAKLVWPMHDEYGWRIGRVSDPFGHHWEIGKRLPEKSGDSP